MRKFVLYVYGLRLEALTKAHHKRMHATEIS